MQGRTNGEAAAGIRAPSLAISSHEVTSVPRSAINGKELVGKTSVSGYFSVPVILRSAVATMLAPVVFIAERGTKGINCKCRHPLAPPVPVAALENSTSHLPSAVPAKGSVPQRAVLRRDPIGSNGADSRYLIRHVQCGKTLRASLRQTAGLVVRGGRQIPQWRQVWGVAAPGGLGPLRRPSPPSVVGRRATMPARNPTQHDFVVPHNRSSADSECDDQCRDGAPSMN